jgi:hypothetical protein
MKNLMDNSSKFKTEKNSPRSTQRNNYVTKEKNAENIEKKNKNSVFSVVKKIWSGGQVGSVVYVRRLDDNTHY